MQSITIRAALLALATPVALASPIISLSAQETKEITAAGDGPYVTREAKGWSVRRIAEDRTVVGEKRRKGESVTIRAVGKVPAFQVPLRGPVTKPADAILPVDPSRRLLVMADTHGEYEIVVAFLRRQGVIDEKLRWSFGNGQMVVTGDIFDRGAHQLEILWLLYKLEAEAKRAGGALHVLLGNHESMILRGDERYLASRYPETARLLGAPSYSALFGPTSVLGDWLRSRPAVLKLGDLLLLHGGISPAILDAKATIPAMNSAIRSSLAVPAKDSKTLDSATTLIAGAEGPQWYRGYFGDGADQTPDGEIDRTLRAYGVSRVLVGHTIVKQVMPLYGGKVIAVQVYPHLDEATGAPILEGALREKGRWFRVTAAGLREPIAVAH